MSLYECILAGAATLAGVSNLLFALYLRQFVKEAIPLIKNINRSTRVLKTDLLLKRRREAVLRMQGLKVRRDIELEDDLKGECQCEGIMPLLNGVCVKCRKTF
jgi:hypothetical protein